MKSEILDKYEKLKSIRRIPKWTDMIPFAKSKYKLHSGAYSDLQNCLIANQGALVELIVKSDKLSTREKQELISIGGHGGSVAKKHNRHWHGFTENLRQHYDELPNEIKGHLDWLKKVHGW